MDRGVNNWGRGVNTIELYSGERKVYVKGLALFMLFPLCMSLLWIDVSLCCNLCVMGRLIGGGQFHNLWI